MKCPATETLEIIRRVEQSHLPSRRTFAQLGIPNTWNSYHCYDLLLNHCPEGLRDAKGGSVRVWNRIADEVRGQIIEMNLGAKPSATLRTRLSNIFDDGQCGARHGLRVLKPDWFTS